MKGKIVSIQYIQFYVFNKMLLVMIMQWIKIVIYNSIITVEIVEKTESFLKIYKAIFFSFKKY